MYVLVIALMFPAINGLAIVKIHRDSVYLPESPCALLHNLTLSSQDSLQTCIWKCTHEQDCQTAVYFNDAKVCSMFVEFHRIDRILPSGNVRASVIACQKNHTVPPSCDIYWSFDGHANDLYCQYNGTVMGNAAYVPPGYNGQGAAIALNATSPQYVLVPKYKNMTYTSFTWEIWATLEVAGSGDQMILGMCQMPNTSYCMHLVVRNGISYFGLYDNDCLGNTPVSLNQWHHFAFVYNYSSRKQYLYLDGALDCEKPSAGPFLASEGNITIGSIYLAGAQVPRNGWTGLIDQVSYTPRAKNASEILSDATLVAYYSFDDTTLFHLDSGPNRIDGAIFNVTSCEGAVRRGILFNHTEAYFQTTGFTRLGTKGSSYSLAVWVKKVSGHGTMIHISALTNGGGGSWCLPMLGLSSSEEIIAHSWDWNSVTVNGPILPLNVWTHLVTTYSQGNGLRLWVNGTLTNSSNGFLFIASDVANTLTLGTQLPAAICATGNIDVGQFYGAMDELRVYARELNETEISLLVRS